VAHGGPDAGMAIFPVDALAEELVALAWMLEKGSGQFYSFVSGMPGIGEIAKLFADLTLAEEHHKASLRSLFRELSGMDPGPDFPYGLLRTKSSEELMEGGVKLAEALSWAAGKNARDILELAMALETDAYDLYIKMGRKMPGAAVFDRLIKEEREHLNRMAHMLDSLV
jgi:sulfur-carrier protein adenylyltransferase/sulfurtransferase